MSTHQGVEWSEALPLIGKGLRQIAGLTARAAKNISEALQSDLVAPQLGRNELTVGATMLADKPEVFVAFGPRDWSFDFETGEVVDCGTAVTLTPRI